MKVCSIYNLHDSKKNPVAFLLYYEKKCYFRIRICPESEIENLPFLLTIFAEQGHYNIGDYWSRRFVQSRIVPPDRQNLGTILKDCNMDYYDEYALLLKSRGKCSHDDYAVEEIAVSQYLCKMQEDLFVEDMVTDGNDFLVFFSNEETRKYAVNELTQKEEYQNYIREHFMDYRIMPGGFELNWNDVFYVDVDYLKAHGTREQIPYQYFKNFVKNNISDTAKVCDTLQCTRQNVDELVKRERLNPVRVCAKNKLFLNADIERKQW